MEITVRFESLEDLIQNLPVLTDTVTGNGTLPINYHIGDKAVKEITKRLAETSPEHEDKPATEPVQEAKSKKSTSKKSKPAEAPTEATDEASKKEDQPAESNKPKEITETDVREALSSLMKGRKDAVRKILKKYKAKNFTHLAAEHYAEVMELAEKYIAMSDEDYKEAING